MDIADAYDGPRQPVGRPGPRWDEAGAADLDVVAGTDRRGEVAQLTGADHREDHRAPARHRLPPQICRSGEREEHHQPPGQLRKVCWPAGQPHQGAHQHGRVHQDVLHIQEVAPPRVVRQQVGGPWPLRGNLLQPPRPHPRGHQPVRQHGHAATDGEHRQQCAGPVEFQSAQQTAPLVRADGRRQLHGHRQHGVQHRARPARRHRPRGGQPPVLADQRRQRPAVCAMPPGRRRQPQRQDDGREQPRRTGRRPARADGGQCLSEQQSGHRTPHDEQAAPPYGRQPGDPLGGAPLGHLPCGQRQFVGDPLPGRTGGAGEPGRHPVPGGEVLAQRDERGDRLPVPRTGAVRAPSTSALATGGALRAVPRLARPGHLARRINRHVRYRPAAARRQLVAYRGELCPR